MSKQNEAKREMRNAKKLQQEAQAKKDKRNSIITIVCVVLALVLVVGLAVYSRVSDSGVTLRAQTAAKSDNYKVTGTMMAYYFNVNYQQYASYLSMLGVQSGVSLKAQECPYVEGGGTWFDYFSKLTEVYVEELLALCEAADKAGVELGEEQLSAIEANIDSLKEQAASNGLNLSTFLATYMGNGVNEDDVRDALEIMYLASKYSAEYQDSLEYTAEERETYYGENKADFDGYDFSVYTVSAADFYDAKEVDEEDEDTVQAAIDTAKAEAEKLAGATDKLVFEKLVRAYVNENKTLTDGTTADDVVEGTAQEHITLASVKSSSEKAAEWIEKAEAGDVFTETSEDGLKFTVYMLHKAAYRVEDMSRDVRHILFSTDSYKDDTKAKEIYAEWEAAGFDLTKFEELCAEYSEDGTATTGGLYENVCPGDMVTEFNDWLFDGERKAGDSDIVKTTYGWHIMYYVGEGELETWEVKVNSAMVDRDFNKLLDDNRGSVTFNEKAINKIVA